MVYNLQYNSQHRRNCFNPNPINWGGEQVMGLPLTYMIHSIFFYFESPSTSKCTPRHMVVTKHFKYIRPPYISLPSLIQSGYTLLLIKILDEEFGYNQLPAVYSWVKTPPKCYSSSLKSNRKSVKFSDSSMASSRDTGPSFFGFPLDF